MDGYTVEEAASVLGVPRERVWELLARGILAGSTDLGGGMRVRLKADPAPPAERATNGGGHPATDATPFRELLTEFRSLTERYGQALLALGEARGEVAGLRTRLETLEARVDLRLPSGTAAPAASSWAASPWPVPTERVVQPAHETEQSEGRASAHEEDAGSHRRRARSPRRATESFAAALARAEDPSPPELPGAAEAAAALAALHEERAGDEGPDREGAAETDVLLPREVPFAEPVPVADEGDEGRLATAAAVPDEPSTEPDSTAVEASPQIRAEAEPPAAAVSSQAASDSERLEEPDAATWDQVHYSAAIGEPEWISEEDVGAAPGRQPTAVEAQPEAQVAPPVAAPAPRAGGQVAEPPRALGSPELDDALAALDALAHPAGPAEPSTTQPEPQFAPAEPPTAQAEPEIALVEPSPARAEPEAALVEPSTARAEPEAAEPEPEPKPPDASAVASAPTIDEAVRAAVPIEAESPPAPSATWQAAPTPMTAATWRPALPPPVLPRSSASRAYRRLRRIFPA